MAEPWIRVHANLVSKPVVRRAMDDLGVKRHEAVGLLVVFWGSVSQHANNGSVGDYPDSQLDDWAGWKGKRGRFAAFIRQHHLDADGRVNEWDAYAGKLEQRRATERDRLRNKRGGVAQQPAYDANGVDQQSNGVAQQTATVRNLLTPARAVRNETIRNESTNTPSTSARDALAARLPATAHDALDRIAAKSRSAEACIASLAGMLNGLNVAKAPTSEELGKALVDFQDNGETWNAALFRKYIVRAIDGDPPPSRPANANGAHRAADPKARARVLLELAKRYNLLRWVGTADDYGARQREAAADPLAGAGFLEEIEPLKLHVGIGDQENDNFAIAEIAKRIQATGVAV